jgi:hypothetical protein
MDQHKLRSLVFEKTGVRIDVDDPVFALVALNEAVLEEAVERHIARIDAASQQLTEAARAAGGLAPLATPATVMLTRRELLIAAITAVLTTVLVLASHALLK